MYILKLLDHNTSQVSSIFRRTSQQLFPTYFYLHISFKPGIHIFFFLFSLFLLAHHSPRQMSCKVLPLPSGICVSHIPGGKSLHAEKSRRVGLALHHQEAFWLKEEQPAGLPMKPHKIMVEQDQEVAEYNRIPAGQHWILWVGEYLK